MVSFFISGDFLSWSGTRDRSHGQVFRRKRPVPAYPTFPVPQVSGLGSSSRSFSFSFRTPDPDLCPEWPSTQFFHRKSQSVGLVVGPLYRVPLLTLSRISPPTTSLTRILRTEEWEEGGFETPSTRHSTDPDPHPRHPTLTPRRVYLSGPSVFDGVGRVRTGTSETQPNLD